MTKISSSNIPIENFLKKIEQNIKTTDNKSRRRFLIRKLITDIKIFFTKLSGASELMVAELKVRNYAQELFTKTGSPEAYQEEFYNYMNSIEKASSKERIEYLRSIVLRVIKNKDAEK